MLLSSNEAKLSGLPGSFNGSSCSLPYVIALSSTDQSGHIPLKFCFLFEKSFEVSVAAHMQVAAHQYIEHKTETTKRSIV